MTADQGGGARGAAGPVELADTDAAVDFLQQLLGVDALWPLIAIAKDAPIQANTFIPAVKREIGVSKWIRRWNDDEGYDIYFAVNPLKKALSRKASKADVAAAAYLWIDLDPGKGADPADEQAALDRALHRRGIEVLVEGLS
jgi:hypothetical protein